MAAAPLDEWSIEVPEEWIDYNGHMSEGYYAVAFGDASDALLAAIGFGEAYRQDYGTFYTLETHIRYVEEVRRAETIACRTLLLGADRKRLHVHHELYVVGSEILAATQESMMLHVSLPGPKAAPMGEPVLRAALEMAHQHAKLERPAHLGASIRQL